MPTLVHQTEPLPTSRSTKQVMHSTLVMWPLQQITFSWRQNSSNSVDFASWGKTATALYVGTAELQHPQFSQHSQSGTASWSCGFCSTRLAIAMACDKQQNHFVILVLGRGSILNCRLSTFKVHRGMIHCIKLVLKLTCSAYFWYAFLY